MALRADSDEHYVLDLLDDILCERPPAGTDSSGSSVSQRARHSGTASRGCVLAGPRPRRRTAIEDRLTERAACALAPQFEEVLAIGPDGEGDPAEVLSRSGAPVLLAQLLGAGPATDRVVDVRIKKWGGRLDHVDAKVACLREAAGLIARLRPTDPAHHAVQLSHLLGVSADAVTSELIEAMSRPASNLASPQGSEDQPRHVGFANAIVE